MAIVGRILAEQQPQTALHVLGELQGTDAYASTFVSMVRGLVRTGGMAEQVAEMITQFDLNSADRAQLVSQLAGHWVLKDRNAAIEWVNNLSAPEDFRAALPQVVFQLDKGSLKQMLGSQLKDPDPVMEQAMLEAAFNNFNPDKSWLILNSLINRDPQFRLKYEEGTGRTREEMIWNAVNHAATEQAMTGSPAVATEWLSKLPFANESDYSRALSNVLNIWKIKSSTEAAHWLNHATLAPNLKATLLETINR